MAGYRHISRLPHAAPGQAPKNVGDTENGIGVPLANAVSNRQG
jgi:hypothetical protein